MDFFIKGMFSVLMMHIKAMKKLLIQILNLVNTNKMIFKTLKYLYNEIAIKKKN